MSVIVMAESDSLHEVFYFFLYGAFQKGLGHSQIIRQRDLYITRTALDKRDRAAELFDQKAFVSCRRIEIPFRQSFVYYFFSKCLRCQRMPQIRSINGTDN